MKQIMGMYILENANWKMKREGGMYLYMNGSISPAIDTRPLEVNVCR